MFILLEEQNISVEIVVSKYQNKRVLNSLKYHFLRSEDVAHISPRMSSGAQKA